MASRRSTIGPKLRFTILERDNFRCTYCGARPASGTGVRLELDHVIPVSKGGKDIEENLVTSCNRCNLGKSDRDPAVVFNLTGIRSCEEPDHDYNYLHSDSRDCGEPATHITWDPHYGCMFVCERCAAFYTYTYALDSVHIPPDPLPVNQWHLLHRN